MNKFIVATALALLSSTAVACAPTPLQVGGPRMIAVDPAVNPSFRWGGPFLEPVDPGQWNGGVWSPTPELSYGLWGPPGIVVAGGGAGWGPPGVVVAGGVGWGPPIGWVGPQRGFVPAPQRGGFVPTVRDHRWGSGGLQPRTTWGRSNVAPTRSWGGAGFSRGVRDHRR
ncbi:MAG TPA: hypothetical protein PLF40_11940 [Kofleriaceae bacterium]|nr:hypothetical protein [Kofleriaceae bacterium]